MIIYLYAMFPKFWITQNFHVSCGDWSKIVNKICEINHRALCSLYTAFCIIYRRLFRLYYIFIIGIWRLRSEVFAQENDQNYFKKSVPKQRRHSKQRTTKIQNPKSIGVWLLSAALLSGFTIILFRLFTIVAPG